ncbi:TonB-dependent receptor [Alphaproteobacteria bacterium]|nr:TonB-dependent receptor [Alphaproteobacteria bacterium]
MSNKSRFTYGRKTLLGLSVATMALASSVAMAQEAADATDEVVVTGIRKALENSVDLKRNAKGIVDSISAEDMGKFPDSNLAESLQRVTGVSIDRDQNTGEGKSVTVRGFGADYNLVTLNGRMMPTSTLGDFASAPSTRSFNFGDLAPEAVAGVDIYKTSRASAASGGMGSTINIRTSRPLDAPGFNATVAVKGINDESTEESYDTETSLLISNTFLDDRFGIALTSINSSLSHTNASYRHQWSPFEDIAGNSLAANDEATDVLNGVSPLTGNTGIEEGTLIANINGAAGYYINDLEQERDNFQLTLQARPFDNLTLTYDNIVAELEHQVRSRDLAVYIAEGVGNDRTSTSVYSANGSNPASIESLSYDHADIFGAYNSSMGLQKNITEMDAHGFNAEWDVDENLTLSLDISTATSETKPNSPYGSMAYITTSAKVATAIDIDYSTEVPGISIVSEHVDLGGTYNGDNNGLDLYNAHRWLGGADNVFAYNENDLDQIQINGSYDAAGSKFGKYVDLVDFGVSFSDNDVSSGFYQQPANNTDGIQAPAWDRWPNYGVYYSVADGRDAFFYQAHTEELQPYFSGLNGASAIPNAILNIPYEELFSMYQIYGGFEWNDGQTDICGDNTLAGCSDFTYTQQRKLEEKTTSVYVQGTKSFEIFEKPATVVAGLRFERTEIVSQNYIPTYSGTKITGDDSVTAQATGDSAFFTTEGDYDYLLPSIDFDVDVRDDIKLRASVSQSIARQTYDKLAGGVSINPAILNAKTGPFEYQGSGSEGNPNLEPFESTNFDLSAEWYYGDLSYASIGYFSKETQNWVGTGNRYGAVQNIRHAAYTDGSLNGAANDTLSTEVNDLAIFNVSFNASSDRKETIDGLELAIQHDFGDYNPVPFIDLTGFGVIANLTIVDSDADYNNQTPNSENDGQFAVVGISDSHNLIAYYERFGLSARVAYNWRDRFLNFQGASSGYTEEYEQLDANVTYTIPGSGFSVSYDALNLTEEGRETFERNNPSYKTWVSQGHAKHFVGVRWKY